MMGCSCRWLLWKELFWGITNFLRKGQALQLQVSPLRPLLCSSSTAAKHGPSLLILKKGPRLLKPSAWGNLPVSPWGTRPMVGCTANSTSLWVTKKKKKKLVGPQESLLATVKRQKLPWFGLVTLHDSHPKTILQGTFKDGWRHGQQRKLWVDNIKEKSGHARTVRKGQLQKRLEEDLCWISPHVPSGDPIGQGTELNWLIWSVLL